MDKAIKTLERFKKAFELYVNDNKVPDAHKKQWESDIVDLKESLIELQAHKAKVDEIATDLQDISQYLKDEVHPRCEYDLYSRLEDLNGAVLQKLEELDK